MPSCIQITQTFTNTFKHKQYFKSPPNTNTFAEYGYNAYIPTQEGELTTTALIVVQGLATGSLLYVVFFEILEKERQKTVPGVLQVRNTSLLSLTN